MKLHVLKVKQPSGGRDWWVSDETGRLVKMRVRHNRGEAHSREQAIALWTKRYGEHTGTVNYSGELRQSEAMVTIAEFKGRKRPTAVDVTLSVEQRDLAVVAITRAISGSRADTMEDGRREALLELLAFLREGRGDS